MPSFGRGRIYCLRIAAVSLLLTGCTGNTTHQVCAVVLAVEGAVTADGQRVVALSGTDPGPPVCPGTIIHTSTDSSAQIACLTNALVHLSENSTVEIANLNLRKDGNETEDEMEARTVRCRLATGTITIAYQGAEGVSEFIAVTPHGTLIAKFSCVVRLVVTNEAVRVACASGMVTFEPSNAGPPVLVEAGFVAESGFAAIVTLTRRATAAQLTSRL